MLTVLLILSALAGVVQSLAPVCQVLTVELNCRNLDRNSITYFQTAAHDAKSSYVLNLTDSVVTEFPSDIFDDNAFSEFYGKNLTFTTFPFNCLQSLLSVTATLDIEYSFFPTINTSAIPSLPFASTLDNLRLAHNALTDLPSGAFEGFDNLSNLDLTFNQLYTLDNYTFSGLTRLESLKLSYNYISAIESDAFAGLLSLTTLILTGNRLYTIPQDTFSFLGLPNLADLQLSDNPFVCNCDLNWLKVWLDAADLTDASGATCVCPISAPFKDIAFCGWQKSYERSIRKV